MQPLDLAASKPGSRRSVSVLIVQMRAAVGAPCPATPQTAHPPGWTPVGTPASPSPSPPRQRLQQATAATRDAALLAALPAIWQRASGSQASPVASPQDIFALPPVSRGRLLFADNSASKLLAMLCSRSWGAACGDFPHSVEGLTYIRFTT
jgi:hypothetical protein